MPESLAVSHVLGPDRRGRGRISASTVTGHMRFAVFCKSDTGSRRIGRIVQRICEIETYKAMSLLGLRPFARDLDPDGRDGRGAGAGWWPT